jgi:hypothetical protein
MLTNEELQNLKALCDQVYAPAEGPEQDWHPIPLPNAQVKEAIEELIAWREGWEDEHKSCFQEELAGIEYATIVAPWEPMP